MKALEYLESKFNDNTRSFTRYDMIEFAVDYSEHQNKELIEALHKNQHILSYVFTDHETCDYATTDEVVNRRIENEQLLKTKSKQNEKT